MQRIFFPAATGGIDAPVYEASTHLFYVGLAAEGVGVINPATLSVTRIFPAAVCAQSGIALDSAAEDLLLACATSPSGSWVMSARTGQIVATIPPGERGR